MKTTVIHHSADYDGIFCREISRKFLPEAELIGWDFSDAPLEIPEGQIYVLDLPVDKPFGWKFNSIEGIGIVVPFGFFKRVVWIDHHKSAIESHPENIPGYRIDGVAACRLAWQWFSLNADGCDEISMPPKKLFVNREVSEPIAVRFAGEYDIWDHRGDGDLEFQFGLRSRELTQDDWNALLDPDPKFLPSRFVVEDLIENGRMLMHYQQNTDASTVKHRSFLVDFEGLKCLALNTPRCNSNTFSALDVLETGHDALMGFYFNGKNWTVSLYHAKHRTDIDLSEIAIKHGGGGHRGACGFTVGDIRELIGMQ